MGVQNALPLVGNSSVGIRTQYATLLPPGSKVAAYVGAIQDDSLDAYSASTLLVATLDAGLARCRAGKGDVVVVLPGHTESFATADACPSLVSGTQIIGVAPFGSGLMPTFTFTGTAATFLLDQANCVMSGLKFAVGIDAVVNFVNVTGAGCYIAGNYFQCGTAAALDMNTALTIGTGASDCVVEGNQFITTSTGVNVASILVSGTAVDGFKISNNFIHTNSPTNGAVNVTGTATGFQISGNVIHNVSGTVPVGIRHSDTALVGAIYDNKIFFTTDVATLTTAITAAGVATANVRMINNFAADEDSLSGILVPTATGSE
jgi:hypothetical protein